MKLEHSLQPIWGSGLALLCLGGLTYGILHVFGVSVGSVVDWAIALLCGWWLCVLVTIPWDLYFFAHQLLTDSRISSGRGIPIDADARHYVERLDRWSLRLALGLHGITTLIFYGLAALHWTPLGYLSSVAALFLTGVRPALRAYRYFIDRLLTIQREVFVPRPDAVAFRQQLDRLQSQVDVCVQQLDPHHPGSWAAKNQGDQTFLRQELATHRALLEQLEAQNHLEHQQIRRESQQAVAQMSVDGQFLSQVREILRFVKEA